MYDSKLCEKVVINAQSSVNYFVDKGELVS